MHGFTMESMKKMHSLFFPINWREAATGVERILLLSKPNIDKDFLKSKDHSKSNTSLYRA